MRLKRISLLSVLSLTLASGCSANRASLNPLDRADDRETIAPRGENEYYPRVYDEDRDLQEPTSPVPSSPVPSGEPLPAPPAFGVSRVKSVGWLKDISTRFRGSTTAGDSIQCVDEQPCEIGTCSPINSCAPESGCAANTRVQRYRQQVCDSPGEVGAYPIRSVKKSLGKLFHPGHPVSCSEECAESSRQDDCRVESVVRRESRPDCREDHILQNRCTPLIDESCAAVDACAEQPGRQSGFHDQLSRSPVESPLPRRECLADPLQEPFVQDVVPTPGIDRNPERPAAVPAIPFAPIPKQPVQPNTEVPALPITPGSSARLIEPPTWPRQKGTAGPNGTTTRHATHYTPLPDAAGTSGNLPQLIPGRRI